jgi:hypothetical protein
MRADHELIFATVATGLQLTRSPCPKDMSILYCFWLGPLKVVHACCSVVGAIRFMPGCVVLEVAVILFLAALQEGVSIE